MILSGTFVPLILSNLCKISMALSIFPVLTSHLALSGTKYGVKIANASGNDVATTVYLQLARKYAIQGKIHAANVKNIAIDIFATNVRHFGPTYSRTKKKKKKITIITI